MKILNYILLCTLFNLIDTEVLSQTVFNEFSNGNIYENYQLNDGNNPCITSEQYDIIEKRCNENAQKYIKHFTSNKSNILLNWPLKASSKLKDCSYYYISAHVDHDSTVGKFKDYNCGTIAYDGHKGTDIAIGPFPFYKMDSNLVEVVAAASGIIVDKHDGEFDKNCAGVGSNVVANYLVIEHSDGSRALYWHMKKNSLTTKSIGDSINAGDFIGIVGSSGSSSGPHLHFEIWALKVKSTMIDPFVGTCNGLNASTWWVSQKSYTESQPIKASVHTTDIILPKCPGTETLNESSEYTVPFQGPGLAPGYAKFYVVIRNETNGQAGDMKILNPDGSTFDSWSKTSTSTNNIAYWGFSKKLPLKAGTYTFQATYSGVTCSQNFEILTNSGIERNENVSNMIYLFPNPGNTNIIISSKHSLLNAKAEMYNELGNIIMTFNQINGTEFTINRNNIPAGVYYIRLSELKDIVYSGKIVWLD